MKEPIERSALLVIDIQDSFRTVPERWAKRNNPAFEKNTADLIAAWREASLPLFFVLHTDSDDGFRIGDPDFRLMDFVDRRETDPLLIKNTRNAFTSTDLQQRLDALGVRRIAVIGITTEQCCETTTRLAADLGYDVDFVTEATLTFPHDRLSAEQIVERTEVVLRGRFARIATVAELQQELAEVLVSAK